MSLPAVQSRPDGTAGTDRAQRVTASMPALTPRRDIQGLRGLAVLLVVLAHAGVPGMEGGYLGVDVFFVLSGYLITTLLLHETTTKGSLSLRTFYAKRARRILPAATLVLVTTALTVTWLLPYVRADSVLTDVMWAALFGANIHFGLQSTDYFASDSVSPVQHFWSLAVEEQFYVVWPALLAILLVLGTKGAVITVVRNRVPLLRAALWLLVAASLAWSVVQTADNPAAAYFSTATRFWELGAGALLSLGGRSLPHLTARARRLLGWGGLAMLVSAVVTFDEATPVPGYAMLLPVVGAVGLLAAGVGDNRPLPWSNRALTLPPLRWLGDVSYGFYLWHWPFLVVAPAWLERELTLTENLQLVGAALVLSIVTYHLVENPIRRARRLDRRPGWSLVLWPVALVSVLLANAGAVAWIGHQQQAAAVASAEVDLTQLPVQERVVRTGEEVHDAVAEAVDRAALNAPVVSPLAQDLTKLSEDRYVRDSTCTAAEPDSEHELCPMGDLSAERTMVLIGDSHAQMWLMAFDEIAKRAGYRLVPLIKLGCTPYDVVAWSYLHDRADTACNDYRTWANERLIELDPDVVVAGSSSYLQVTDAADGALLSAEESAPLIRDGVRSAVQAWSQTGADVRLLGDVPRLPVPAPECLSDPDNTSADCTFELSSTVVDGDELVRTGVAGTEASFISVLDMFCLEGQCPTVVEDMVLYRDDDHITGTYAAWVADELERRLALPAS